MKLVFVGLGKMGQQMVQRLSAAGHEIIAHDVNPEAVAVAVQYGAVAGTTREDTLAAAGERPVVWLMIPAQFVDAELDTWLEILPEHSIVIDGGNSDFRLTQERYERSAAKNIHLVDVGTSGGILGAADGFSLMIGGDDEPVAATASLYEALAQPDGWKHLGPSGAGHYIKMVHNAIEYGLMESYAEGYRLLKEGPYVGLDLGTIGSVWEHGSIVASLLNKLNAEILAKEPELTSNNGIVDESGEAGWSLEVAREHDIWLPAIEAAHTVRVASQAGEVSFATRLLAAQRHAFGGHAEHTS